LSNGELELAEATAARREALFALGEWGAIRFADTTAWL
jgi:hypothetical protein